MFCLVYQKYDNLCGFSIHEIKGFLSVVKHGKSRLKYIISTVLTKYYFVLYAGHYFIVIIPKKYTLLMS